MIGWVSDLWIEKGVEDNGRSLIWGSTLAFADWWKTRKISTRITKLRAQIWTRDLPNTNKALPKLLSEMMLWMAPDTCSLTYWNSQPFPSSLTLHPPPPKHKQYVLNFARPSVYITWRSLLNPAGSCSGNAKKISFGKLSWLGQDLQQATTISFTFLISLPPIWLFVTCWRKVQKAVRDCF
jgi:hypothetical protein